jgi:hypothetical protein
MDEDAVSSPKEILSKLSVKGIVPLEQMRGDDEIDDALLREMSERSSAYLLSFKWCAAVTESYFGGGIGGIVAVFLHKISPTQPDVDEYLWVVVGDVPSAYFVVDDLKSPREVLESFIWHRLQWVRSARRGKEPADTVMPVPVPATPQNASELHTRLKTIKREFLPWFRKS